MDEIRTLYKKYQEIINYLIFGGLTTLVNLGTFFLVSHIFNDASKAYIFSNAVAWFISVLFAFITNRRYVFQSKRRQFLAVLAEMGSFFGLRLASLFLEQAILYVGITLLALNWIFIKVLAQIVVILSNYIFSKFIFQTKEKE